MELKVMTIFNGVIFYSRRIVSTYVRQSVPHSAPGLNCVVCGWIKI